LPNFRPEHVCKRLQTLVASPQKLILNSQKVIIGMSADEEKFHQHVKLKAKANKNDLSMLQKGCKH
jgi:hypothetical protein